MQRIRIGLTGLAFVFLLVLVGTMISRSSRDGPVIPNAANTLQNQVAPSDPLSDLGVDQERSLLIQLDLTILDLDWMYLELPLLATTIVDLARCH